MTNPYIPAKVTISRLAIYPYIEKSSATMEFPGQCEEDTNRQHNLTNKGMEHASLSG